MKRFSAIAAVFWIAGGAALFAQVEEIEFAEFYEFVGYEPGTGEMIFSRSVGTLFKNGSFSSTFNSNVTGDRYAVLNRRFSLPRETWDAFENPSPGYYTDYFDRSELFYSVGEGVFARSYYLVNVNGGNVTPGSIAPFSFPEGWQWTQGEWNFSQSGGYWYWIPSGPPFLLNLESGLVTTRPIDGWNYHIWPYFYDASTGVWHYVYQGNLPYVYRPDIDQWRKLGSR